MLSTREQFSARQFGENVTGVAQIPLAVAAVESSTLDATDATVPALLRGTWQVAGVQYTPAHTRLLLRKVNN